MGPLPILVVVFVWLKVGHAIDLSWWWLLLPVGVTVLNGLVESWAEARRDRSAVALLRSLSRGR